MIALQSQHEKEISSPSCFDRRLEKENLAKTAWRRKSARLPVDTDGNLTQDGRWDYVWDAENRLTSMTAIGSVPAAAKRKLEFVYDYRGRRIQKKVYVWNAGTSAYDLSTTTKFLYDGWNCLAELNGSGTVLRSYVWGNDLSGSMQGAGGVGGLLMMNNTSDASSHFYCYDGNGNVVALVNAATGAVSAEYEYGPFGETIRQTGTMASVNTHRFSTKSQDDTSGLLYYGYRYLNTSSGRWISRDPIGDTAFLSEYTNSQPGSDIDELFDESLQSPYHFVLNDAINSFDFLGLNTINGAWETGPTPSISSVKRTGFSGPKINPGGNIGVGLGGVNYTVTGTIKGKIRCREECPLGQLFTSTLREWHLDVTGNISFPLTSGIGVTQKYVNYGYNVPHKISGATKAYSKYEQILKAIAEGKIALDALCKANQQDATLTLDLSIQK